jgi:hypothetical protein
VRDALRTSDRQCLTGSQSNHPTSSGPGASAGLPAVRPPSVDPDNLLAAIERIVVSRTTIEIELAEGVTGDDQNRIVIVPWMPPSPYRRREIIQGEGDRSSAARPMRAKTRAVLMDALRDAHRWLDELIANPDQTIEAIATREVQTERWIRRTLSLAFLCPPLMQGAIEGRLPRGFGVKRLMDLPLIWADQWAALGLKAPIKN